MEISFLVALTSSDNNISQSAAKGLRLISQAEQQPDAPPNPTLTDEDRAQRNPIYEQLGDPRVTVIGRYNFFWFIHTSIWLGRVGHQKRIRKLVRMLSFSAGIQVVVWEECYWRWRTLNESMYNMGSDIIDGIDNPPSHSQQARSLSFFLFVLEWFHVQESQDARFQWQNLTLFLAALAGSCVQAKNLDILGTVIAHKYLPDRMRIIQDPSPLIEDFLTFLMTLLVSGDTQTRDIAREALGSELSSRLYGNLIKHLES